MRISLSVELNKIYDALDKSLQRGARRLFCELTDIDTKGRDIRRPRTVRQLANSIGLSSSDTRKIIDHFIEQDVEYLYVRDDTKNLENSMVDVSHECILRLWSELQKEWLAEEQQRADDIRILASFAKNHEDLRIERPVRSRIFGSGLLDGYTLQRYTSWFQKEKPSSQWASRYLNDVNWRDKSTDNSVERNNEQKFSFINNLLSRSRWRQRIRVGGLMFVVLLGMFWFTNNARIEAKLAKKEVEQANRDKEAAIIKSDKLEREFNSAIDRVISDTADNIEQRRPEGASLYASANSSSTECEGDATFCGRLASQTVARFDPTELRKLVSKPLCSNLEYVSNLSQLGSNILPFCAIYPNPNSPNLAAVKPVSEVELSTRMAALKILNSSEQGAKARARSVAFGLAKRHPDYARFFFDLSLGYSKDIEIAPGRRFSEANACKARELMLLCGPNHNARALYKRMQSYSQGILGGMFTDGKFFTLNKDVTALKIMMAAEFLDDATLNREVDISEASIERISRLWRGFDGASDAARALYQAYNCADNPIGISQCDMADELYDKATKSLPVIIEYSKLTTPESPIKLRKQLPMQWV